MKVKFFIPKKNIDKPIKRNEPMHLKSYTEEYSDNLETEDENFEFYKEGNILQLYFEEKNHFFKGHFQIATVVNVILFNKGGKISEKLLKVYLNRI